MHKRLSSAFAENDSKGLTDGVMIENYGDVFEDFERKYAFRRILMVEKALSINYVFGRVWYIHARSPPLATKALIFFISVRVDCVDSLNESTSTRAPPMRSITLYVRHICRVCE